MTFSLTDIMGSSIKTTEAIKINTDTLAECVTAMTQAMGIQIEEQKKANDENEKRSKLMFINLFKKNKIEKKVDKKDPLQSIASNVKKIVKAVADDKKQKKDTEGKSSHGAKGQVAIIKDLGKVMGIFALLGPFTKGIRNTGKVIKEFLINVFAAFNSKELQTADMKKIKETLDTLQLIGSSIWNFTKNLAKSLLLAIPAALGFVLIMPMVWGAMKIFVKLSEGKNMKNVKEGALALNVMAGGLLSFTASLALSTLIVSSVIMGADTGDILATLGVFALAFCSYWLFSKVLGDGKNVKNVLLGALALGVIGVGLVSFSWAIKQCLDIKVEDLIVPSAILGVGALAILALGAIGLIGGGVLYGFAAIGALVLVAISGSLLLFGLGLEKICTLNMDENKISEFVTNTGSIMRGMAELLPAALLAIPASIAMLTVSLSALVVCKAIEKIGEMNIDDNTTTKINNFGKALNLLKAAFLGEEPKEDKGGFWGGVCNIANKVGGAVGGALDMVRAVEAAGMYIILSVSAIGIAAALKKLSEFDQDKINAGATGLNLVLGNLASTFSDSKNKELFKTLGEAMEGIKAFNYLGSAISNLATGIALFGEMESQGIPQYDSNGKRTGKFTKVDYVKISSSIVGIIKCLADALNDPLFTETVTISCDGFFGAIGCKKTVPKFAAALESFSPLGSIMDGLTKMVNTFGQDIDANKVKEGINTAFGSLKTAFTADADWMKGLDDKFEEWEDFHYITDALASLNGIDLTKAGLGKIKEIGETINNTKIENLKAATVLTDKITKLKDLQTDKLEKMFEKMIEASEKMIEMLDKSNTLTENLSNAADSSNSEPSFVDRVKSKISGDSKQTPAVIPASSSSSSEPQEIRIYLNNVEGTTFKVSAEY